MPEYTNPAKEVVSMCSYFSSLASSENFSTYQVLAMNFSEKGTDSHKIIINYQRRIDDLLCLVGSLDSDHIDEEVKADALRSIERFEGIFLFENLNSNYRSSVNRFLSAQNVSNVRALYSELNRSNPISYLNESDIDQIRENVSDDVIEKFLNSDLPPYVKYSLISGIENLKFSLDTYSIFGAGSILGASYELAKDIKVAEGGASPDISDRLSKLSTGIVSITRLIHAANKAYDNLKEIGQGWSNIIEYIDIPPST
ncbi:hypothetical protein ABIE64_000942 [Thalassospira sp. MBR-102]|jgi:hypothetical protein|uniref:hypothetical protein n=1 Tax=Thalassospira sp. MBR-102 TaxID=3156466 RepID=UPI003395F063